MFFLYLIGSFLFTTLNLISFAVNDLKENQVGLKQGGFNVRETDLLNARRKGSKQTPAATTSVTTTPARITTTEKPCPTYFAQTCSYKCVTMNNMYLCICPAGYVNKYNGHCSGMCNLVHSSQLEICLLTIA